VPPSRCRLCYGVVLRERGMQSEWVFFDGGCGFCHRWVQLVVKHDHDGRAFRFAPRKGETFRSLVDEKRRETLPPSILVLTTEGQILTRSSAVLHILDRLDGIWRAVAIVGRMARQGSGMLGTGSSLVCGMGFCPCRTRRAQLWRPSCERGLDRRKAPVDQPGWSCPRASAGSRPSRLVVWPALPSLLWDPRISRNLPPLSPSPPLCIKNSFANSFALITIQPRALKGQPE
jgi:predicted DCC family thiol-disulfide oxidoreductase YuxK